MNISEPFVRRPIGTTLLSIGLFVVGAVAYMFLPVASMPSVDFPVIFVGASRPGADPATMASSVAAPLERAIATIPGVNELTSYSALGSSRIIIQFDQKRNVDRAAQDVQAALNIATTDLPGDLPALPSIRKANPSAAPVLIMALVSETLPASAIYDAADTVVAQRLSQVEGVGQVSINGAEQPAVRVHVDASRVAAMGLALDDVRAAIANANAINPVGSFEGGRSESLATSDQAPDPVDLGRVVVKSGNGTVVRLSDVATVEPGVRNDRVAGSYNGRPAVLINITKTADANVIKTVDAVKALLPSIKADIPAGIDFAIMSDRTRTIRASVDDIEWSLLISIALVMAVVFLFLRRATPTLAAGVTVPLSLGGTFACMWVAGFTVDTLSLMAITIAVGFVVDDAIVMIENVAKNIEAGMGRIEAAIAGARQIGFTVVAISLSLVAAFLPLLLISGPIGTLFREFSLTITFAIAVSTVVSLTVTPMICGNYMRHSAHDRVTRFDRLVEGVIGGLLRFYAGTLGSAIRHPWAMLLVTFAAIGASVAVFQMSPKGNLPEDDTGLIQGFTQASPDVSFAAMNRLQQQATDIINRDPDLSSVASFVGNGSSVNSGQLYLTVRDDGGPRIPSARVITRLRAQLEKLPGIRVFLSPVQDIRAGARQGNSRYQFTLWTPDLTELAFWGPKVLERLQKVQGLVDVSSDRQRNGLQANVQIDRVTASRLGVAIQDIDTALGDAFGQKQISTIYGPRNQYKIVMDIGADRARDPNDLSNLHVSGSGGQQVPLSSVIKIERSVAPLVVNHQGSFPSETITYDVPEGGSLDAASAAVQQAVADMHLPETLHADFAGDAKAFNDNASGQGTLLLAAVLAIYIILGVLYESLIHPLTILSTLPSAGLGALVSLRLFGLDITVIAFIGIILLIGLVKKNGIMLVDFAITAERERGVPPSVSIFEACLARFRPILMTTLAALFGAVPLMLAEGPGAELRRPLGVTIVGGLILSQIMTLYTTPAIYLLLSKLRRSNRPSALQKVALVPAE